jgi:hypothetical protein
MMMMMMVYYCLSKRAPLPNTHSAALGEPCFENLYSASPAAAAAAAAKPKVRLHHVHAV